MSMRRRIKPAVSLAPRRAPTVTAATPASAPVAIVPAAAVPAAKPTLAVADVVDTATSAPPAPAPAPTPVTSPTTLDAPPAVPVATHDIDATAADTAATAATEAATETPPSAAVTSAEPASKPKLPARRIKPAVCLPVRKRKAPAAGAAADEADSVPAQSSAAADPTSTSADDTFKSPSQPLQPLLNNSTPDPAQTPDIADTDSAKAAPAHRQRIRPTPCFGTRRNSSQGGNESETSADTADQQQSKRQRNISTCSSNSAVAANVPAAANRTDETGVSAPLVTSQHSQPAQSENVLQSNNIDASDAVSATAAAPLQPHRQRTESECSTVTETAAMFSAQLASTLNIPNKPKKTTARSDESQRIAQAKRDFQQRFNGQQPDKAQLTMFDMIFYNPTSNPMKNPAVKPNSGRSRRPSNASSMSETASLARSAISGRSRRSGTAAVGDTPGSGGGSQVGVGSTRRTSTESNESLVSRSSSSNVSSHGAGSSGRTLLSAKKEPLDEPPMMMPVPQLKLGPNGEIVLDEKSLVIETTGDKEARAALANAEIVYDDEFSGTSGFYKRNKRTRDWPADETIRFYRCLHTIGTDFSLMLTLFPNRSRRDLKLKFKKEERVNSALINKALLHPNQFNIDELKQDFEREKVETERLRAEWEKEKEKERRKREDKKSYVKSVQPRRNAAKSSAQRMLADSDGLYELADAGPVATKRRRRSRRPPTPIKTEVSVHTEPMLDVSPNGTAASDANDVDGKPFASTVVACVPTATEAPTPRASPEPTQHPAPVLRQVIPTATPSTPPTSPPITISQIITSDDLGMSCRNDMCSDQFVDPDDEDDILNMEIVFERDEYVTPDGQSPPTATYSYTYGQSVVYAPAPQPLTALKAEDQLWRMDDVMVGDLPALPQIAQIQHNNVVLYDVTQSQESGEPSMNVEPISVDDAPSSDADDVPIVERAQSHTVLNDNKPSVPLSLSTAAKQVDVLTTTKSVLNVKSEPPVKPVVSAVDTPVDASDSKDSTVATASGDASNDTTTVTDNNTPVADGTANDDDEVDDVDDDDDDEDDDLASLVDSLVVVARQDASGNVVHEVFLMSPTTGQLSEEPLDLPADVIERIKASLVSA